MDEILQQLGGLVLGSVPTIVFFLLLVLAYGFLVRQPLARVLSSRRDLTTGAMEQARGAISAAEAETAVYEDKLRAAKNAIYEAAESKRKQWATEREAVLEQTHAAMHDRVQTARREIEQSSSAAKLEIQGASVELSARIIRAVLPAGAEVAQ